jgi:hypothetical protein
VLIRKRVPGEYELVIEDSHYHRVSRNPKYYEEKYDLYEDDGMVFKSALFADVNNHLKLTSFWHGGDIPNAFADFGIELEDSVSTSCSFVYHAAKGTVPWEVNRKGWNLTRTMPDAMQRVIGEYEYDDGDGGEEDDDEDDNDDKGDNNDKDENDDKGEKDNDDEDETDDEDEDDGDFADSDYEPDEDDHE